MKPVIGIVGGTGAMGSLFKSVLEKQGYKVIVSSRHTELNSEQLVKQSDVVIICVPISSTAQIIKEIIPYTREDQLLTDLTSLKEFPVKEMLKSKAAVIGMHPVFGPMQSINGQTVVLCPSRPKKWLSWLKSVLEKAKAEIVTSTPEEHDKMMSLIQVLRHFSTLVVADTIRKQNLDLNKMLKLTSPVYKINMDMTARLLAQDPNLYADISMFNPNTQSVIKDFISSAKELSEIDKSKNTKKYEDAFLKCARYFGDYCKQAMNESNYLIGKLVDKK